MQAKAIPPWLVKKAPPAAALAGVHDLKAYFDGLGLHTVCESARCPNAGECFAARTATFLILGDVCTRNCRYCAVDAGRPLPPDAGEPGRVAEAIQRLGLRYAVITSVTRDDLADGGAAHFAAVIDAVRRESPETRIEVLIPDFGGREAALAAVCEAGPDVLSHNVETVPRLYARIRPTAGYWRSVELLALAKSRFPGLVTKSGVMVGLGETAAELLEVFLDLAAAGCDILTIGQYLRPTPAEIPVDRFVPPEEYHRHAQQARRLGFAHVEAGPFVRSSYLAEKGWQAVEGRVTADAEKDENPGSSFASGCIASRVIEEGISATC